MMKKNKIIGIAVASLGVLISFSSAFALYKKGVDPVGFGIGAATYTSSTDTVSYKINSASAPTVAPSYLKTDGTNGGTAFDDEYRHAKYEFTLGASYAEGLTVQDYIVGNLSVSLTGIPASLQGKVKVSMYFDGYVANSLGAHFYGNNLTTGSEGSETAINETTISGASLSVNARDICVATSGVQKFVVYFALDDSVDVLSMNEANDLWTLSVTWGTPVSFNYAYLANTQTLWAEDDEFVMAPNIAKSYSGEGDWEWYGQIKGTAQLTQAKPRQGDAWAGGSNLELTEGTIYNVCWSGVNDAAFSYTVKA